MRLSLLVLSFTLILFSCKTPRYSYSPTRINAPLLKEKKELQLDASLNTGPGMNTSAAYAVGKNIGIMLNSGWIWDRQDGSTGSNELLSPISIKYTRRHIDAAVGYFLPIDDKKTWVVELYGGFGKGYLFIADSGFMKSPDTAYSRRYRSNINRFFIQPAIGYSGKSVQIVFYLRLLYLRYNDIRTNYTFYEMDYYNIPTPNSGTVDLVEMGYSLRFYFPPSHRFGLEISTLLSATDGKIDIISLEMSAGLHFRLQKKK